MIMDKLINGQIPAYTTCPYKDKCELAAGNSCHHLGVKHSVSYSCAAARSFEIIQEMKERKEK
jgi:hypothetical protein